MIKILLSTLTFTGLSAMANPACLSQVSNYELSQEVARRLNSGSGPGPGTNGALLSVNCDMGGNFYVRSVHPSTGATKTFNAYAGTSCQEYVSSLLRVTNQGLTRNLLISYCDVGGNLYRILASVDGNLKSVSQDYIGTNCKKTALDANSLLQP